MINLLRIVFTLYTFYTTFHAFFVSSFPFGKVWRSEQDTHTLQNGSFNAHSYADTINLLLDIGEQAVASINAEILVSPIPYSISPPYGC